jgi:DNA repair photolyase
MEPRTSRPAARLRAIKVLSDAGIPVRVMVAPLIPGLNDSHVPAVLQAASEAGATSAGWNLLRLPWSVHPVFRDWLRREQPSHVDRVEGLIQQTREGGMNSSKFGERLRGKGLFAEQIARTFKVFSKRTGLDRPMPTLDSSQFSPPCVDGQLRLF